MTNAIAVDRERVRAFFEWTFDGAQITAWGAGCIVVSLLCLWNGAYTSGLWLLALAIFLFWFRSYQRDRLGALYGAVEAARRHDFSRVLQRSYEKIATDIRALQPFETHDTLAELSAEAISNADLFDQLLKKSVFLYGRGEGKPKYFKRLLLNNELLEVYSPIEVSILYLTAAELIVYTAALDLRTGDLPVEEVRRLNLRDIVEIQSVSQTIRFRREDDQDLFEQFEKLTQQKQKADVVLRKHAVRVTRKDGQTSNLPVGVTAYTSGATGVLDGAHFEEEKIERFASEIVTRLNDAKSGAPLPPTHGPAGALAQDGDWSV